MAGKPDRQDDAGVGNWPTLTENHWYALAVTSALLTAVAVSGALLGIFADGFDPTRDVKISQALAPFGVALFAVVTFCTVCWRGSITTRQVNQAEAEGRAKLLQEGAKLLGETGNPSHVSAGLATLEILVTGADDRMAIQAMNLVADFVQTEMEATHHHRFRQVAFTVLENGHNLGREANRDLRFSATSPDVKWQQIRGVQSVQYVGGRFQGGFLSPLSVSPSERFLSVTFEDKDDVVISRKFLGCVFIDCSIAEIKRGVTASFIKEKAFHNCDFSTCVIHRPDILGDRKAEGNYYLDTMPPMSPQNPGTYDWSQHLLARTVEA